MAVRSDLVREPPSAPALHPIFHTSWPPEARELVLRAIDRHGGWPLWGRLEAVMVHVREASGFLPWAKGLGRTFPLVPFVTSFPKRARTEWRQERGAGCVAVFERGDVRLLDPDNGGVRAESLDHRRTFRGLRKLRRWGPLDAFYFFGYAFASYAATPFVLPSLRFCATVAGTWRGVRLRGVDLEYPAEAHVSIHSRRQRFFFDESGLLRRNDYVAEVVGALARGAHGWDDHATVQGLPLPARRTVLWCPGSQPLSFPTILSVSLDGFEVRLSPTTPGGPP